jgi:predicted negative regulator of RcsB-dependent stress response
MRYIGSQPIVLAGSALMIVALGLSSIATWRAYTGTSPEQERATSARLLQTRAAQVSEELVEKTKGLEQSQQETIDQVQGVGEQLQAIKRLLAAQQADTKRLREQVGGVAEAVDTLRQSFASTRDSEVSAAPAKRRSIRLLTHAVKAHRKMPKSKTKR